MTDPIRNKNYTAADFEQYHSGKMSEIEMNALEKAALEDPFVADALEGYAYTETPEKDIDELKEKLFSNKKNKKIFFINKRDNVWMKIAATVILIVGMGYLAYYLNSPKQNNSLAKNEMQKDVSKQDQQPVNSQMDSVNDKNKNTPSASVPQKRKEFTLNKDVPPNAINKETQAIKPQLNNVQDDKISASPANINQALLKKSTVQDVKRNDENIENGKVFLKGKVEDTLGYAKISDAKGKFTIVNKDSLIIATATAPGFKPKDVMLRDKNDQVVPQTENRSLNEVRIRGDDLAKQKSESSSLEKLEGKAAGVIVNKSAKQPIAEQEKFDEYVRKNIRIPKNESGENYKGKVILSFDINKKGHPKNIKADQSLCADCDKEAIRLLEKSPKWKYIKKQRQVVTVQF